MSKFDFDEAITLKRNNSKSVPKLERSPYDLSLAKFNLDSELVRDCKMKTPYRNTVREAMLTLEIRIREKLALADSIIGVRLIDEARNRGVFKRTVKAEEEGLYMLYRGAMLHFRNPPGHRKIVYSKEDALKILFFSDYLIKLFMELSKSI